MNDPAALWSAALTALRKRLGAEELDAWFAPLRPLPAPPGAFRLQAPSPVYARYLLDQHKSLLEEVLSTLTSTPTQVSIASDASEAAATPLPHFPLNPRYTFATFVPGPSNQFARAAAEAVADNPGKAYNPLFIYGASGLGKTHLLHAIGNAVSQKNPQARVCYVPTEKFVNDLITSIRLQRMHQFRDTYRTADLLLLDDCHALAGKERSQEEFFHTFNALHEAGKQIVLTSDTAPAKISGLEERLRTRFVWGLVADVQPPDLETKCAIIREKAHLENRPLPDDVVTFIARRSRESIRELEGYLNRLFVYLTLTGEPPTLETARKALSPFLPEERTTGPQDIIRFVAHHYGVKVADLKGRDNRRSVAFPRQVAMYLLREILNLSFPEIGKLFNKHHTTVMYSVEQIAEQRRTNPALDATLTSFLEHFH